jgi:branched-chain amino acid aminotransferase
MPQLEAAKQGYAQNLWLHGPEHYLTEVSTRRTWYIARCGLLIVVSHIAGRNDEPLCRHRERKGPDRAHYPAPRRLDLAWCDKRQVSRARLVPLRHLADALLVTYSVLTICREHAAGQVQVEGLPSSDFVVSEKHMTMPQLVEYQKQGKLKEVFGSGTAAIVSAVNK